MENKVKKEVKEVSDRLKSYEFRTFVMSKQNGYLFTWGLCSKCKYALYIDSLSNQKLGGFSKEEAYILHLSDNLYEKYKQFLELNSDDNNFSKLAEEILEITKILKRMRFFAFTNIK